MCLALGEENPPFQDELVNVLAYDGRENTHLMHGRGEFVEEILVGNAGRPDLEEDVHHLFSVLSYVGAQEVEAERKGRGCKEGQYMFGVYGLCSPTVDFADESRDRADLCGCLGEAHKNGDGRMIKGDIVVAILFAKMAHE